MRQLTLLAVAALWAIAALAQPEHKLQDFDDYPHTQQVASDQRMVQDHEVGLGAMQKVRGVWRLKDSERLSGDLVSYTWRVVDGYTSREIADEIIAGFEDREPMFACEGRRCGSGAQWASRVFGQRILYGLDEYQRYQVFRLQRSDAEYRLLVFDAARTADRQYLHVELLRLAD